MPGGRFARLVMETRRARAALGHCPSDTCVIGVVFYVDDDTTAVKCDACRWTGYDEDLLGPPLGKYRSLERLAAYRYQTSDERWRVHRVGHQRWEVLHRRARLAPYVLRRVEPTLRAAIAYIEATDQ